MLVTTHNTHFHDKIKTLRKISIHICILELSEEFLRDSKTSKRVVDVRVINGLLFAHLISAYELLSDLFYSLKINNVHMA